MLTRRGASAAAGRELAAWPDPPSAARDPATGDRAPSLPPRTAAAVKAVLADLAGAPFLAPDAQARAAAVLARLPQPFTTAEARQALGTTRRVAIPLLEYLDRAGITQRLPDDRRRLRLSAPWSTRARRRNGRTRTSDMTRPPGMLNAG